MTSILSDGLPTTFELLAYALVISLVLTVPIALLAARNPGGFVDRVGMVTSMAGLSVANYVLAVVLVYVFAVRLGWLPAIYTNDTGTPGELIKSLTLPAISIGFPLFCFYTRLLRADILEQMQGEDYVVTAKAKGVGPWRVLDPPRAAQLALRAADDRGAQPRDADRRDGDHRADLRRARHRPLAPGGDQQPRRAGGRGDRARPRRGRRDRRTCSPTCCTRCWTRGSGMGAQLPEAEAGGVAATLAVAPTVAEPAARRRGWTRNLDLIIPGALIGLLLFLCFVWPLFGTVPPPTGGNILDANAPSFSAGHFLGTDQVGNDLWSRLLYGGRNSLEIAFAVNVIGLVIGGLLGALAAYLGLVRRHRDHARPRRADRVPVARPGAGHRRRASGRASCTRSTRSRFFSVPAFARLARGQTLRLRERPFMLAARLSGTRAPRILLRHVAPNILPAAHHLRAARHRA